MGRKNNITSAFTLIEVMIVVMIIGLLTVLGIVYFRGEIFKGNDARRKSDLARIRVALEEFEKDHNCYPQYVTCGEHADQPVYPYLRNVPCDPVTHASYVYETDGSQVCAGWYRIFTNLQNMADASIIPGIGPGGAYNYYQYSPNAPQYTPSPGPTSQPPPSGGGGANYWGCKSGVCTAISWDPARPPNGGWACDSGYSTSDCSGQCGTPQNPAHECIPWQ